MAKPKQDKISFRWGIDMLDQGMVVVPNLFFNTYARIGVDRTEFLLILHLARYHYESPIGQAHPSQNTLAQEMGVSRRRVRQLRASLEEKGLLHVIERSAQTSIYDVSAFSQACVAEHALMELSRKYISNSLSEISDLLPDDPDTTPPETVSPNTGPKVDITKISQNLNRDPDNPVPENTPNSDPPKKISRKSASDSEQDISRGEAGFPPGGKSTSPRGGKSTSPEEEEGKKKKQQQHGGGVSFSLSLKLGLEAIKLRKSGIATLAQVWSEGQTRRALSWVISNPKISNPAGYLLKMAKEHIEPDDFTLSTESDRDQQNRVQDEQAAARRCWERDRQPCRSILEHTPHYTWCQQCALWQAMGPKPVITNQPPS